MGEMELCYSELVEGYYKNLNDTLRNFRGGPGFLESWVHDENHNRSLLEICDLAALHHIPSIAVRLTDEVSDSIDIPWLSKELKKQGTVSLAKNGNGSLLTFVSFQVGLSGDQLGSSSTEIGEAYKKELEKRSAKILFETSHRVPPGQGFEFSAESNGVTLRCLVDSSGKVLMASHQGAQGLVRGLMDEFCSILEGRPMQEGAEHGVIRLENRLRDPNFLKGKGIVIPQNADPIFQLPLKLIRQMYKDSLSSRQCWPERNYWRDSISPFWLEKPIEVRRSEVEKAVRELCVAEGIDISVNVQEVKHDKRFVLAYAGSSPTQKRFSERLIRFEQELRRSYGVEIELQMESLEDKNKREQRTARPPVSLS